MKDHRLKPTKTPTTAKGGKHPEEVVIGKAFVANPKGSKPVVIGKRHIRVEGDKPRAR
jgi:hypothetical protein